MILSKDEIKKIIPHRDPMLLIDSVTEHVPGKFICGKFHVKKDWDIFKGHFPEAPVLPGVLSVECMAQLADILILSQEKYKGTIPYFIGIDNARFRSPIKPDDEIDIEAEVLKENKDKAIVTCVAKIFNNGLLVSEAEVSLAMR